MEKNPQNQAQCREFGENNDYEDVGYLDLRLESLDNIVNCILKKLKKYKVVSADD